jgi:hypothetical protein
MGISFEVPAWTDMALLMGGIVKRSLGMVSKNSMTRRRLQADDAARTIFGGVGR